MSPEDRQRLKERVAALRDARRINTAQATCYLHSKKVVLLPDGFRHMSESEYADAIAEVEEALGEGQTTEKSA